MVYKSVTYVNMTVIHVYNENQFVNVGNSIEVQYLYDKYRVLIIVIK